MKRALAVVVCLAVLGGVAYAAWLNPHRIDLNLTTRQSFSLPLGWLLVFTFTGGVVVTLFLAGLRQLALMLRGWPRRRRARDEARAAELESQATALLWGGDVERALALFRKARRRRPEDRAAVRALACACVDAGDVAAARAVLGEALARDGTDAELAMLLGDILADAGETAEAIRCFESVRLRHPRAPRVLASLRDLYWRSRDWVHAVEAQEGFVRLVSNRDLARVEEDRLLRFRYQAALGGSPAERVEALAALVGARWGFVPAIVSLGDAYVACGRAREAVDLWERALRDHPRAVLVERLLAQGTTPHERQRTLTLMRKRQERFAPDTVRLLTAWAALADGEPDRAAAELDQLGKADLPAAQRLRAEIHRRRREPDPAIEILDRLADLGAGRWPGYRCTACGRVENAWSGFCAGCEQWDTFRAAAEEGN